MPVRRARNGKWRIGRGPAVYKTKADADAGMRAMHARKNSGRKRGGR